MPDDAGIPDPTTGQITMPPLLNLTSQSIVPYGLYLLDDGVNQFLWVGRDTVPALLGDVFGVEDRTQLKQGKASLPVIDNDFNERVRAVVDKSGDHKSKGVGSIVQPSLYIIKEDGEPSLKLWAQTLLVEDRADQGESIVQWISKLREKVRWFQIRLYAAITNALILGCSVDIFTAFCRDVACNNSGGRRGGGSPDRLDRVGDWNKHSCRAPSNGSLTMNTIQNSRRDRCLYSESSLKRTTPPPFL